MSHRAEPVASPPGARAGFTLVELMIAMLILTVGMLALSSTSASVVKAMTGGRQQTLAAQMAQSRLEQLRGVNCAQLVAGTGGARGVTESWGASAVAGSNTSFVSKLIVDTVTYRIGNSTKSRVYLSIRACP
ncbi:MAG: hypothetical protein NVS4B3_09680 [Gemmatimonadaceae bacterium]